MKCIVYMSVLLLDFCFLLLFKFQPGATSAAPAAIRICSGAALTLVQALRAPLQLFQPFPVSLSLSSGQCCCAYLCSSLFTFGR
ncbi:hypothetical protein GGI43DRAFT_394950 [Trichoderma evansii]